ncbi:zinc-binding alcohol dehydrogenase family protein [Devosia sp. CN2-171]|uniref:zinc-binding alcohol dehydrogenase family protein n=1 Tax=Devosia sp. CN2-171 TaxID=3400909 RepID=UPI003BF924F1
MHALVCRQPGVLEIETRPAPHRGEGEALVRPLRVGICGTDYHIYEGKHPFLEYPRVMGHELAVEVLEAPAGSGFAPGEICVVNPYVSCGRCIACRAGKPNCCVRIAVLGVHRDGGMALLLSLPVANLVKAVGLSIDACATVEFLAIGAHAVRRAGTGAGKRGLVIGAGPIGLGVALFGAISGLEVSVLDLDAARLETARAIAGATPIPADEAAPMVAALTDGEGFDFVFDATGNAASMQKGFDYVAHGGTYVLVSVVKGPITFEDPDFHRREMSLLGSRNATSEDFQRVIAAIAAGNVPIDKLITHRTTLAGAARDIPVWATQKRGLVKAVIEIAA